MGKTWARERPDGSKIRKKGKEIRNTEEREQDKSVFISLG
jgi:hypothetical protein